MPNVHVPRLIASLLTTGCVLAVAACGGGGGAKKVSAELYTGSVCSALSTWQQQLTSASTVLAQKTSASNSLDDVRNQFVAFFGGAIGETVAMLQAVEDAGVPDVNQGERVATALLQSLRRFRPILVEARAKARRLPVEDESLFASQAQTLGAAFQIEASGLSRLFQALDEQYKAPELARAANADATCADL